VPRIKFESLQGPKEDGGRLKEAVLRARENQKERFKKAGVDKLVNAELETKECDRLIELSSKANDLLKNIFNQSLLSARGYYRLLKTARTIADLEGSEIVESPHVSEAFQLRVREE